MCMCMCVCVCVLQVNMVRWDPTKELLAASSDDSMVRVSGLERDHPAMLSSSYGSAVDTRGHGEV